MKVHISKTSRLFLAAAMALMLTGVASARHDDDGCTATQLTLDQLKAARQATAAFNSIQAAENAFYTNINLPIPNMGEHWLNADLLNDGFDPEKPEALVYADLGNGRLQLVAVEYLAPYDPSGPPEGFAGTCDRWSPFPSAPAQPIFWTLHAWIWHPNIAGTFAKTNPLIP